MNEEGGVFPLAKRVWIWGNAQEKGRTLIRPPALRVVGNHAAPAHFENDVRLPKRSTLKLTEFISTIGKDFFTEFGHRTFCPQMCFESNIL